MRVGVVGLGAVGFSVAAILGTKFPVTGIDTDAAKVTAINERTFVSLEQGVNTLLPSSQLTASTALRDVAGCDIVFLCLPSTSTDFSAIEKTLAGLDSFFRKDVVLSSTVFPGFTRRVQELFPGLTLSYVPVRTFEGMVTEHFYAFPHLIGTFDGAPYERIAAVYQAFGCRTISAVPPEKAELAKLFSNVFRQTEMAIANELAAIAALYGEDANEIFRLTNEGDPHRRLKKPGIWGGYCLPKDTAMLGAAAQERGYDAALVAATEQVRQAGIETRARTIEKAAAGRTVVIEGVTSKPIEAKVPDARGSPVLAVIDLLTKRGVRVSIIDPNLSQAELASIAHRHHVGIGPVPHNLRVVHTNYDLVIQK